MTAVDSAQVAENDVWEGDITIDPSNVDVAVTEAGFRRTGVLGIADPGQAMLSSDHSTIHIRTDYDPKAQIDVIAAEVAAEGGTISEEDREAAKTLIDLTNVFAEAAYTEEGFEKLERIPPAMAQGAN